MQGYTVCRAAAFSLVCALAIGAACELDARSVYSYIYHESDGIAQISDSRVGSDETGPLCAAVLRLRVVGGGAREYITVYGANAEAFALDGARYARGGLEDAGCSRAAAEKLRAVVNASYPYVSLEEVIRSANAATEPHKFDALTEGDAIAASQAAIWSCASAEDGWTSPMFSYKDTRGADGRFRYDAERDALINGLRDYLLSLGPQAPAAPLADIFQSASVNSSSSCFSLEITCGARGSHSDGAPLTLLATSSDGAISGAHSLGDGRLCLTLTAGSIYQDRMKLTLTCSPRAGEDVYLYRAEAHGRAASQSLVGRQSEGETTLQKTFCYSKTAYNKTEEHAK